MQQLQPPKGVEMPDMSKFTQSEYAFYATPRKRGGYTKYAMLGDQNYNDIREANNLPTVQPPPVHRQQQTWQPPQGRGAQRGGRGYPQPHRGGVQPQYMHQPPSTSTQGGYPPPSFRGRGQPPSRGGRINPHGGVPPIQTNTHHRVNALPHYPQQNAHMNYQPPSQGPSEGVFRNNPSLGTQQRAPEPYAAIHSSPSLGSAPPPSGVQFGDPGNILPSGAPADQTFSSTRFIKEGYGTYRGTGVGKTEEELRNRDTRNQVNAMHNYATPNTAPPPPPPTDDYELL